MTHASPGALLRVPAFTLLALLILACADNTTALHTNLAKREPATAVPTTVMVTNATCDTGPCVPLAVGGWVPKYNVPGQPFAGFMALGNVDSASACLTIPSVGSLVVVGPGDTTVIRWTPQDGLFLTAGDARGTSDHGYSAWDALLGKTQEFVPAAAPGWHVTFPGDSGRAEAEMAESCGGFQGGGLTGVGSTPTKGTSNRTGGMPTRTEGARSVNRRA
ncbi:MAG: hypothetical protein P8Z36_11560 [Gemmatimonadota bacterium]